MAEVDESDPQAEKQRIGHAERGERNEDNDPGDDRREDIPHNQARDRPGDFSADRRDRRGRFGDIAARMATRIFGASSRRRSTNANTAASDATTEMAPLPRLRAGLLRFCVVPHELRGVLVHPGLNVVLADEMSDPALPVLCLVDVARQIVREVRDAVDQRVAEGHRQAGKEESRPDRHDGDGEPPTRHSPTLQRHHQWVQDERDEPTDQHEEHHVPQSIQQLAEEIHRNHDRDGDQNCAKRDRRQVCPPQEAGPSRGRAERRRIRTISAHGRSQRDGCV